MLPDQRHAAILAALSDRAAISIRELTAALPVSRETLRKDIEHLASLGKLAQVRGGATRIVTAEPPMENRARRNPEGKTQIAARLIEDIPDGASVILDNGSTLRRVARCLVEARRDLTVYTNDLKICEIMAPHCRDLVLLGGQVDPAEMATFGLEVIENLSRYHADFAVISAGGLSAKAGLTDFSRETADLRHRMLQQGAAPYVLIDHGKFDQVGQVALPALPDGCCLISDQALPPHLRAALPPDVRAVVA